MMHADDPSVLVAFKVNELKLKFYNTFVVQNTAVLRKTFTGCLLHTLNLKLFL